jgi:hypothetical protein
MHIAHVAPLTNIVSPAQYGLERGIAYLIDELVRQGHQVTLVAANGSETAAELVAVVPQPVLPVWPDLVIEHVLALEQVYSPTSHFDLIHVHFDAIACPMARRSSTPTLTTVYYPLEAAEWLAPIYSEYQELPLASLTQAQHSGPWSALNWFGSVPYGIPRDLYRFQPQPGQHLVVLGAAAMPPSLDDALAIAGQSGLPLKVGLRGVPSMDPAAGEDAAPPIDGIMLQDAAETEAFLGDALALLVPMMETEPAVWAVIEALACGTPVLAHQYSWAAELIEDGVTGAVFTTPEEAIAALDRIRSLSRQRCREAFEARFTSQHMAQAYLALYEQLCRKPGS